MIWLQGQVQGYQDVDLKDFHLSWRNGLAFCALVHSLSPRCGINFESLSGANAESNLTLAFSTAEKMLGVPKLLDVEDMIAGPKPEQFSVITYLGQFYKKFGGTTRQLVRTTTAPQLMTPEKTKQLESLAEVRERFGIKTGAGTTGAENKSEEPPRKSLNRTVSVAAIPSSHEKSASDLLREKGSNTNKPSVREKFNGIKKEDLFKRCHKSGLALHNVTPVDWNGNVYHPDHFLCTSCSTSFKGSKEIVNVNNEPYCKECGKKAFLAKNKKTPSIKGIELPESGGISKKIVPLEAKIEEEEVTLVKPQVEQKSAVPLWRQKLAEKKEQLKTDKVEIESATKRMSHAKQKRLSRKQNTSVISQQQPETLSSESTINLTPLEAPVECKNCGQVQKKTKFCSSCGTSMIIVEENIKPVVVEEKLEEGEKKRI